MLQSGCLAKCHFVPSVASVTSVANDKGDNEMKLRAVNRSPAFALQMRKTSARRPSDEGTVRPVITSNGVPFLQMRSVGSHATSGREKEGNGERMRCILVGILWMRMQIAFIF